MDTSDTLISLVDSSLSADSTYLNSQVHILWDEWVTREPRLIDRN